MALIVRSTLLLMLLVCAGCVTDQSAPSSLAAGSEQSTITVTRSSDDVTYMAAAATVELNGKEFATLAFGRSYTGSLPPGPAVIKVSAWTAPVNMASHRLPSGSTSYRFNAEPGKSYSFVILPRQEPATREAGGSTGEVVEGRGGPFQIAAAQ